MRTALLLLALVASAAGAGDEGERRELSDAQRAEYWRLQAEGLRAVNEALRAQIRALESGSRAADWHRRHVPDGCVLAARGERLAVECAPEPDRGKGGGRRESGARR